jgi:hypothetical protein
VKNEAGSQTEPKGKTDRSDKESAVREFVERDLERFGGGNIVEVVRNVLGDEPIRDQPPAIRLFAVFYLGVPFVALLWFEWQFRRLIPLWVSLPLTAIGLVVPSGDTLGAPGNAISRHQSPRYPSPDDVTSPIRDEPPGALDARLFARFLVSEIKLYNRDLVTQGVHEGHYTNF